jgi:hypothetical protein
VSLAASVWPVSLKQWQRPVFLLAAVPSLGQLGPPLLVAIGWASAILVQWPQVAQRAVQPFFLVPLHDPSQHPLCFQEVGQLRAIQLFPQCAVQALNQSVLLQAVRCDAWWPCPFSFKTTRNSWAMEALPLSERISGFTAGKPSALLGNISIARWGARLRLIPPLVWQHLVGHDVAGILVHEGHEKVRP